MPARSPATFIDTDTDTIAIAALAGRASITNHIRAVRAIASESFHRFACPRWANADNISANRDQTKLYLLLSDGNLRIQHSGMNGMRN